MRRDAMRCARRLEPEGKPGNWTLYGLFAQVSLLVLGVGACARTPRAEVTVFAAASLRDVLQDVARSYERLSGGRVEFNFAGSNVLAHQIDAGAAADIFLSADLEWIEFIEECGRAVEETRRPFLSNELALIARPDRVFEVADAAAIASSAFRHLALANPNAVPAGRYARAWLEGLEAPDGSVWDAVESRVAPALDVRAALALVESSPDVLGLVYLSDAVHSDQVDVLVQPASDQAPEIVYGAVRIAPTRVSAQSRSERAGSKASAFYDYLFSDEASEAYARYGFGVPQR